MRVFYFSGTKLPSQKSESVHVMKMAQAFSKAGHDVTLFAKGVHGAASDDIFRIYDTEIGFKLYLSSQLGIPLLSSAKRLLAFKNKIAQLPAPDLIYGHDPVELYLFSPENTPIIFEVHQMPSLSAHRWAFSKLIKQSNCRAIIAVSDVLKKDILKSFPEIEPENIFVAHDGADLIDHISSNANGDALLKGRADAFKVGYAGSLNPGKGLALISRMAKIRPEYDFHVLGGTRKQVQNLQTHNRLSNIHYYGHKDHADVAKYLKAFDVAVAPYQHRALIKTGRNMSRWISPMKIFEYMAAEKPIICSDLEVIHEILEHEKTALLLPAGDEEKWAEAIDIMHDHPDFRNQLAHSAYESLRDKYTWDKRTQAIMSFCFEERPSIRMFRAG